MNETNFQNSLARAQELMLSEEFNAKVESKAGKARKNNNSNDLALFEAQAFGYAPSVQEPVYERVQTVQNQRNIDESGLPEAIIKSMKEMPPMSGDDSMMMPSSVVEKLMGNNIGAPQNMPTAHRAMIMEQQQTPASNIDYSLIKTIVEECFRQHEKKQLNEGVVRGFKIGNGNKIQFLDSRGNLYEGVLTLKKKANK